MEDFERFWEAYPKRRGSNPKKPARLKFLRYLEAGISAEDIIAGAENYAKASAENIGTPYIAQAITWLNQERWRDYEMPGKYKGVKLDKQFIEVDTPQWEAWSKLRHWPQTDFRIDGSLKRGWFFDSEWPNA